MTDSDPGSRRNPPRLRPQAAVGETSGMFTAILGALLGEDWTTPKIEELRISPDRCLLARVEGEVSFKTFLGAESDLIHNIHGLRRSPNSMAMRWLSAGQSGRDQRRQLSRDVERMLCPHRFRELIR